jgi:MFS family permease
VSVSAGSEPAAAAAPARDQDQGERPAARRGLPARLGAHLLREDTRVGPLELAVVLGLLLAGVAAVFGHYALNAGFTGDDWSNYALWKYQGFDGLMAQDNIKSRPVNVGYIAFLQSVFGTHMSWQLAWSMGLGALMGTALYGLGRLLRFPPWQLACFLVLLLLFPGATSLRLWIAAAGGQGAVTLAICGLAVAVLAFRAPTRGRALALHGASVALLAASLLWYESSLGAVLVLGPLLYRAAAGRWRPALARWVIDGVVLATLALTVTTNTNIPRQSTGGTLHHVHQMWDSSRLLLFTKVLPFGAPTWFGVAAVLALPLLGLAAWRLADRGPQRDALGRQVAAAVAGLALVAVGYAMYAPSIEYYQPASPGIGNRINNVAGIGWMVFLTALITLAATLALRGARRPRAAVIGATVAGTLLLTVNYLGQVHRDSRDFESAFAEGQHVLTMVRHAMPRPAHGSTIWTFGQPIQVRDGIPVFGATWDMTTSVQVTWDDPSLYSYIAYPGTTFACTKTGVAPSYGGGLYDQVYGKTIFINTVDGSYAVIRTRRQCEKLAPAFPRAVPYAAPTPG